MPISIHDFKRIIIIKKNSRQLSASYQLERLNSRSDENRREKKNTRFIAGSVNYELNLPARLGFVEFKLQNNMQHDRKIV